MDMLSGNSIDGVAEADAVASARNAATGDRDRINSALENDGFEDGVDALGE